jgi:hypothetical protein
MKGGKQHMHWDIHTVKKTRTEESKPYIERANNLFAEIKKAHPGSPWSARATWEQRRGFGVDLRPDYRTPYKQVSNPMKPPKL